MRHFIIARLLAAILAALTVSDATCEAALTLGFETTSHKAAYDMPLPWPSSALIDAPHRFIGSADPLRSLAHVEETTLGGKTTDYVSGAGMTIARLIDGVPTYVHSDHLGSPREFSTSAGGLAGWAHYSPFGVDYHSNLPGDQAGFTGPLPRPSAVIIDPPDQLFGDANLLRSIKDSDTGLNYMQARYYDPIIGRFLSVDPVTFMDTGDPSYFNRYRYCSNDPINCTDPTGQSDVLKKIFDFGADKAVAQANSTMSEAATTQGMSSMDPGRNTRMMNDTLAAGALSVAEAGANAAANIGDQLANEVPSSVMEGDKVGVGIGLATALIPARTPGKNQAVRNAAESVGEFLGDAYKVKRNDSKGFVAMSADGNRRFRSDIGGHGDKPHAHLEIKNEHGNFKDATDQHRIYYDD